MLPGQGSDLPLDNHSVYEAVRTIGRGQRSFVQVARNKFSGEQVAIKFIPRGWEPGHTKYVAREILNHQELSLSKHPHIVEFKEVFLTNHFLAEVLEYVEGETLQVFLEKVGGRVIEGLARFIFQQLIIALDFCHRKGKVNRDIKLSNILLSIVEGQLPLVKLCDFGFSKDTQRHSEPHSQVGTALFVAPEVMQNFSGGRYDGQAADVWACGVCLFIMLFGRHPYLQPEDCKLNEQQQMIRLFQRMMQNQVEFPPHLATAVSPECLNLLSCMLRTNPGERSTMADIQHHIWFTTALPEGAGLMNDLFLAEDAALLSPQSQSQIEQLVALAAKFDDMPVTRVQLPSAARVPPAHLSTASAGGVMQQQHPQHPPQRPAMSAGGLPSQQQQRQQAMQAASRGWSVGMVSTTSGGLMAVASAPGPSNSTHSVGAASTGSGGGVHSHLLQQRGAVGTPPNMGSPLLYPGSGTAPTYSGGSGTVSDGMQQQQQAQSAYSLGLEDMQQQPGGLLAHPGMMPHLGGPPQQQQAQQQQAPPFYATQHQVGSQQHLAQQQQLQQQGSPGPEPGPARVSSVLNMIPDLDAMIMSMPETDLLQAATIDLRPYQQGGPPPDPAGLLDDGSTPGPMGPMPRLPSHMHRKPFVNSILSCAPGSAIMPGSGPSGLTFTPSAMDPTSSSFLGSGASGMLPGRPSGMDIGVGLAPLTLTGQQQQQAQQQQVVGSMGCMALGDPQGSGQGVVVDAAPFLYEGNDDDLPMIGSVSAVMPKFDWTSFNAPVLGNNAADLLASQQFNASRFTRVCRDVRAKLSETSRTHAPSGCSSMGVCVEEEGLQQQISAMGMGLRGPLASTMCGSNGPSRLGLPPQQP